MWSNDSQHADRRVSGGLRVAGDFGCILARFPEPLAQQVRDLGLSIPDQFISSEEGREDKPHVTIKFGLHTSDPDEVRRKLAGQPPVRATVGPMCVFHGDRNPYVVLRFQISGIDLVRLNRYISREFECTDTWPSYRPHATIAYLIKNDEDPYYYQKFYEDSLVGTEIVFDTVEFSTADRQKFDIPLGGTWKTAAALELLGIAKEMTRNGPQQ